MPPYSINLWNQNHDSSDFSCGIESIDNYIKNQTKRDLSKHISLVFVLTKANENIVLGYYTLSSTSIVFNDLPLAIQKKLPRYPQLGGTLLGRLGVDRKSADKIYKESNIKPRFGEYLLYDAQWNALQGASLTVGSTFLVIDVLTPSAEELKKGAKDPLNFYAQYGFNSFPGSERRLFKSMSVIEKEFQETV